MLDDALRETHALQEAGEFDPWMPKGPFHRRPRLLRKGETPSPFGDYELVGETGDWLCDTTEGGAKVILAALTKRPSATGQRKEPCEFGPCDLPKGHAPPHQGKLSSLFAGRNQRDRAGRGDQRGMSRLARRSPKVDRTR